MNVSRPLVALAATGALLLSGCGSTTLTAAEQVPGLRTSLAAVDSALEHRHYSSARAALDKLITEARAGERDGTLSAAAAARIIHAARALLAELPHPRTVQEDTPLPPATRAPSKSPSATPSKTPSAKPTPSHAPPTPQATKSAAPTPTPTPTPTPSPSPTPTDTISPAALTSPTP